MRALLLPLLWTGCAGGKDARPPACDLAVTVGTGSNVFAPLTGGAIAIDRGISGWVVALAGRVQGAADPVAVLPTVLHNGRPLDGSPRPTDVSLDDDGEFAGVPALLVDLADPCDIVGGVLEVRLAVTSGTCTATASRTGWADVAATGCDSDTATDTATDTGAPPGERPKLRALHAAATLPPQSMLTADGNAGLPPLEGLSFGIGWPRDGGARRPADDFVFEFFDTGEAAPWVEVPGTLAAARAYTLLVVGTRTAGSPAPADVLLFEDDLDVPTPSARIRWTHASVQHGAIALSITDAVNGAPQAGGLARVRRDRGGGRGG